MIIDHQWRAPRYIIADNKLIHQYTGCYVQLHERSNERIRTAAQILKQLMYARGYSACEIACSILVGSYPIK